MTIRTTLLVAVAAALPAFAATAAEPDGCRTVRFSDVGWTDITATNGVATAVLTGLGYKPNVATLSVPVGYEALKKGDEVITQGGLIGKVIAVRDDELDVEIAQGVKVRVVRGTVAQVLTRTAPAAANS